MREFFKLGGLPLCALCGDEFDIRLSYRASVAAEAHCVGCGNGFTWSPPESAPAWEELHLHYFEERRQAGEELRCPVDDCVVVCAEYSDGSAEFRCPFCARSGASSGPVVELDSR